MGNGHDTVTNPHTPGGATSVSDQLGLGVWVVGFYLDADKQQPIIMGSVGRTANSTSEATPTDPNPGGNCKSFTTYITEENQIPFDQDAGILLNNLLLLLDTLFHLNHLKLKMVRLFHLV